MMETAHVEVPDATTAAIVTSPAKHHVEPVLKRSSVGCAGITLVQSVQATNRVIAIAISALLIQIQHIMRECVIVTADMVDKMIIKHVVFAILGVSRVQM